MDQIDKYVFYSLRHVGVKRNLREGGTAYQEKEGGGQRSYRCPNSGEDRNSGQLRRVMIISNRHQCDHDKYVRAKSKTRGTRIQLCRLVPRG